MVAVREGKSVTKRCDDITKPKFKPVQGKKTRQMYLSLSQGAALKKKAGL